MAESCCSHSDVGTCLFIQSKMVSLKARASLVVDHLDFVIIKIAHTKIKGTHKENNWAKTFATFFGDKGFIPGIWHNNVKTTLSVKYIPMRIATVMFNVSLH